MPLVSPIWTIHRLLRRHRRATALLGILIVLGVAALNVHAALPEHHDAHGVATVCVAALSLAVMAAIAWRTKRSPGLSIVRCFATLLRTPGRLVADGPRPVARAGPPGPAVLRL
jgi:hypothetical protein